MPKKKRKAHKTPKPYKLYDGGKLKNPSCLKCGTGVRMAIHKDRQTCGKCGYTIFNKK